MDSGFPAMEAPKDWERKLDKRTLMSDDDQQFVVYRDLLYTGDQMTNSSDPYGHGAHVAMTVADGRLIDLDDDDDLVVTDDDDDAKVTVGIAPGSNVVMVRALDEHGQGEYSKVIEAVDWIVANQARFKIRVLNLSLDGIPAAPYWYDPLGQAVMKAWQAGIVVVAAAGNRGPDPLTIGVPGNVPYVITVGALKSGRYTASRADELATYSSAGPTESKFVKPDVLVPASRTIAALPRTAELAGNKQTNMVIDKLGPVLPPAKFKQDDFGYYQLSGTSMAAAEVSGIVALMLQKQPGLTNNQVKHRLRSTALMAGNRTDAQYSIWQQGAGRVQTVAAVHGKSTDAANVGMDIGTDLLGEAGTHYFGNTDYDEATNTFNVADAPVATSGYTSWAGGYTSWAGGYTSWAGGTRSWAGGYTSWAGGTRSWAGSYTTWAGSYTTWAGSYTTLGDSYEQNVTIVDSRFKLMLPLVRR